MEAVAYSGITEVATFLLLHRKGVDNLTDTKLHAKFIELTGDNPCTRIELSLEVNPISLEPPNEFLTRICHLQGITQLAREYHANSTTTLKVDLLICINGIITTSFSGTPYYDHDDNHGAIRHGSNSSSLPPPSFTGACITLQLPLGSSWTSARGVARYFHLLCMANTKVKFVVSHHGNSCHKMIEYHGKDHMTINIQGHTLMTTLHPHYSHSPGLSNQRNKLHAVRGKKQMISEIRMRSGDTVALQVSVVSTAVPGLLLSLVGKKLPADRMCKAIHVTVYGPGGVPVFPSSSNKGLLLSQVAKWEDYGVAIGNQYCVENASDDFDQTVIPSFSNELIVTKDPPRVAAVERNCVLHVFLFIEATIESGDASSTDSTSHKFRSLHMLRDNLEDIQLRYQKQFHTVFHSSLNKLLCNYNNFNKINSTLEEAIPSLSEAVASIISHSKVESFQHLCYGLMEVEPTGDEVQQWLTDRLWRIASHKLGAQYHNGQLIRAAEEPDTPDITAVTGAAPSHHPSPALHHTEDTMVTDPDEESVISASRRRCYHPSMPSSHHNYITQMDSISSEPYCAMADSFTTLEGEDLEWSDTDSTTSNDMTDDELWSDDNTVVNDSTLWDDDNISSTHSTNTISMTTTPSLHDTSTNDILLLQDQVLIPPNTNVTTNEMLVDTESTNHITARSSSDRSLESNIIGSDKVIPIEAHSILTTDSETSGIIQDEASSLQAIDHNNNSQSIVVPSSRMSSLDENKNCFDELTDLPSSPEMMTINSNDPSSALPANDMVNVIGYSNNAPIMNGNCLLDQLSTVSNSEIDDDCVAEDFDWN